MLAQLILTNQVVLLCSDQVYLFYQDTVYTRSMHLGFYHLPRNKKVEYCPIWALIDVDYEDEGPPISSSSNIWPIQASSPKSVRWRAWAKQDGAAILGMPLWNMDELMEGYVFSLFSLSATNPVYVVD